MFLVGECDDQFFGMFFALRLKPKIFQKLISFEMKIKDIVSEDFATFEEDGCNFPFSFFAYNEKIASLLYIRYYAHLISHQNDIQEIGAISILKGGEKLIEKIHLKHFKDDVVDDLTLKSYSATINDVLLNEDVLKVVFGSQDCVEENK